VSLRELEPARPRYPDSGRAKLAKVTALRTLERIARKNHDGDHRGDDKAGFHARSPEWWDLDRHAGDQVRERWRLRWMASWIRW
jgi:hypothetical protein